MLCTGLSAYGTGTYSSSSSVPVQLYGAVTLNNTLCFGVFLLIVHFKRLTWTYTSEVATLVGELHVSLPDH